MDLLPAYQRLEYSGLEPSQAFDVVYGGQFEHRLLSARRATLRHQRLALGPVRVETGTYDFPVIARGAMPPGVVCIGLMAEGAETTRYNTMSIGPDEVQIYPQGVDLLYHAAATSRWINFAVAEAYLQEVALARTGRPLDLPARDAVSVQLARGRRAGLIRLVDDAFALGRSLEPEGVSPVLGAEIATGLVCAYVEALLEADLSVSTRSRRAARQHLHIVLACERLAAPGSLAEVRLAEIAQRSGYSRRALELIFNRSVGMSPGRWFMNIRLNGALRELLKPVPGCRVAEVAARWGFRHLPRFAEHYRRAFGELPSQTLARARPS